MFSKLFIQTMLFLLVCIGVYLFFTREGEPRYHEDKYHE